MERLEPIPSPPGTLWREFCHRVLPVLVFAAAVLGVARLWDGQFAGYHAFGEAEPRRAVVSTVEGGLLTAVNVQRFQEVRAGDVIAEIEYADVDNVRADLAALAADLKLTRARMAIDESRNDQGLETLRVRWLEARAELASERAVLVQAQADYERNLALRDSGVVSVAELDLSRAAFESTQAAVAERERLVESLAASLPQLETADRERQGGSLSVIEEALSAQEEHLARAGSARLRAPIDGVITLLHHRQGERVPRGAVIATVTAREAEHILGYVRAPLSIVPEPGMKVEVRTRGGDRQVGQSTVLRVGADLQVLTAPVQNFGGDPTLAQQMPSVLSYAAERGLPFLVSVPSGMRLHPGELVDVFLTRPDRSASAPAP